jgi:hypothetical protein
MRSVTILAEDISIYKKNCFFIRLIIGRQFHYFSLKNVYLDESIEVIKLISSKFIFFLAKLLISRYFIYNGFVCNYEAYNIFVNRDYQGIFTKNSYQYLPQPAISNQGNGTLI